MNCIINSCRKTTSNPIGPILNYSIAKITFQSGRISNVVGFELDWQCQSSGDVLCPRTITMMYD